MDLSPYIDGLQRDLAASAAPGGPEVTRAAELLGGSLEASARLCLLEALSEAAAEITSRLRTATVDVRLRGREADLTVTEIAPAAEPVPPMPPLPPAPPGGPDGGADPARITLRLHEALKEHIERAAAAEGISVNQWIVRVISAAVHGGGASRPPQGSHRSGRRITGFAQA
jgi:HicB-like protein involved in pilus formation